MARKSTPEQAYLEAMETMLSEGSRIEEITATKVQKLVGGNYSKIVGIVGSFKESYLEKQDGQKTAPLSPWFKSLIEVISGSVSDQLTESWFTINTEISSSIALASERFEEKKVEFKIKAEEDLEQIKSLEAEREDLLINSETIKEEIETLKNQLNLLLVESKNKDEKLAETKEEGRVVIQELKAEIKKEGEENKQLSKLISQLEVKLENSQKQNQTSEKQQQKILSEIETIKTENEAQKIELAKLTEREHQQSTQIKEKDALLKQSEKQNQSLTKQIEALMKNISK